MKQLLSVAILAFTTGSAIAADLPTRKEPLLPPPLLPTMWTGFYVGLNAGGIWGENNPLNIRTLPLDAFATAPFWAFQNGSLQSANIGGFIGGGQIGYNWQTSISGLNLVTGLEADIQGIASDGGSRATNSIWPGPLSLNLIPGAVPGLSDITVNNSEVSTSVQYIGTVRGRLGWLATSTFLVYGTGGLAYGSVNLNALQRAIYTVGGFTGINEYANAPWELIAGKVNYSSTMVGYSAGGGFEWMFLPNWSVKAEYLYYNLGALNVNSVSYNFPLIILNNAPSPIRAWTSSNINSRVSGNIVRAGVNYHFNWSVSPVVANY